MHLRATQTENDYLAGARVNAPAEETQADELSADSRALQSVKGGSLSPGVDAGAARSLQRMAGNAAFTTAVQRKAAASEYDTMDGSAVHDALGKSGEKLPTDVQRDLNRGYGTDLSGMEIIRDDKSTTDTNSAAYTAGGKVVVPESFDASSSSGRETLAHEATHYITQNTHGHAEGTPVSGGVSVSSPDDHYEVEAHANGQAVANGGYANVASAGISASTVQRQAEEAKVQRMVPGEEEAEEAGTEEKTDVQQLRVQRSESEGDEVEGDEKTDMQQLRVQRNESEGDEVEGDEKTDMQQLRVQRNEQEGPEEDSTE